MKTEKRDKILYAHIQKKNLEWIHEKMVSLGYSEARGMSRYLDSLFTKLRNRKRLTL